MCNLRVPIALSAVPALGSAVSASAQVTQGPPPCVSDWACGAVPSPLGFHIDTITDDGRYITLEDGSIWEVQIDHRATVAGWQSDDFVTVRRIWAPNGDYEWQFTQAGDLDWHAAVRLAGWTRTRN